MNQQLIKPEKKLLQKQPKSLSITKQAIIVSNSLSSVALLSDIEIKQLLVFIFSLIGITADKMPDEMQSKILIIYIREHLNKFTVQDFRIAFILGIKNKLNNVNIQSYQNFNILYLENVMQAYNQYRFKIIQEAKNIPTPPPSEAKQKEIIKNIIIDFYKRFKTDCNIRFSLTSVSYDYLENLGLLNINKLVKKQYQLKAEKIIKKALILKKANLSISDKTSRVKLNHTLTNFSLLKLDYQTQINNKAKELLLYNFLLIQKTKKIEIKDLIEKAGKIDNSKN